MSVFKNLLAECDAFIKAGESQKVAMSLSGLNATKVPREFRLPLAKICSRSGLTWLGLKLLTPLARGGRGANPTAQELAEYGLLLQRNGSTQEALNLLRSVQGIPETLFYEALCHFSRWDYAEAVPLLLAYQSSPLSPYSRAVAEVNLAAAFVALEQDQEALHWLEPVLALAATQGQMRLLGNGLELRAQVHLQRGDNSRARADLEQASGLLAQDKTHDQLFVEKWTAYLAALETESPQPLLEFRDRATVRGHWESVREADLLALRVKFVASRFAHLIFGTPYVAYRDRVSRLLKRQVDRPFFRLGPASAQCFEIHSGTLNGKLQLNPGKKIHQLLMLLTRDLYRPSRLGGLFAELFPGEYFDVFSSASRVHQIVRRTRRWIESRRLALRLVGRGGAYALKISGDLALHLPLDHGPLSSEWARWQELTKLYPEKSFSAEEARLALKLPRASFNRLTQWGEQQGLLTRLGAGNRVRYQRYQKVPVSFVRDEAANAGAEGGRRRGRLRSA